MTQKTRIQISNQHGNTDITVVSENSSELKIDINELQHDTPEQIPSQNLEQVFQAKARQRMQKLKNEFQETQAFMQKMQELAETLETQNQMMAQAVQQQVQELEDNHHRRRQEKIPALEP